MQVNADALGQAIGRDGDGAVTVTLVDCDTPANVAETLVDPAATAVSNPLASIVAVAVDEELHVTSAVRSEVLPSL